MSKHQCHLAYLCCNVNENAARTGVTLTRVWVTQTRPLDLLHCCIGFHHCCTTIALYRAQISIAGTAAWYCRRVLMQCISKVWYTLDVQSSPTIKLDLIVLESPLSFLIFFIPFWTLGFALTRCVQIKHNFLEQQSNCDNVLKTGRS